MTIAILFGTFVIALIIGIPVSVSLGISAVVSFIYCDIPLGHDQPEAVHRY